MGGVAPDPRPPLTLGERQMELLDVVVSHHLCKGLGEYSIVLHCRGGGGGGALTTALSPQVVVSIFSNCVYTAVSCMLTTGLPLSQSTSS